MYPALSKANRSTASPKKTVRFTENEPEVCYIDPEMSTWPNGEKWARPRFQDVRNARKLTKEAFKAVKAEEREARRAKPPWWKDLREMLSKPV
ncbi:hypothetical protein HBH98_111220 [Parastagonospora nodorum]|nr:hypothetical protein HBH98_111220 [Parastagonospora nodorum]KAH4376668.1 hypothetical protein HBH97_111960 [Parastagonospora nodorum]KAH4397150.1 hypothetical protein HBH99_118540 [Parastagonospora nodorum]KAH4413998.1 hypothetical protein HBH92_083000 [Parastagonospora nodorum]KAH4437761.1 hypothetical protein HBH93_098530 [Parastagonospora nodorum]